MACKHRCLWQCSSVLHVIPGEIRYRLLPSQIIWALVLLAAKLMQKEMSSVSILSSPCSNSICMSCHTHKDIIQNVYKSTCIKKKKIHVSYMKTLNQHAIGTKGIAGLDIKEKSVRNFEVVQTVFTLLQTWHRKYALTDFILQKWKMYLNKNSWKWCLTRLKAHAD